jgi:hypothetical protein
MDRLALARVQYTAVHDNPYFPAGMPALLDAITAAAASAPARTADIKPEENPNGDGMF